ncbi:unnamed protein product [Arabidopsis lyrata]|uniref:DNAJ heat shock N-terminal domain-containing protein n=1 Tax=Arabidopsis lyrata subsp. lyrata TaxID=81972 RepID=D7LT73_ARALL|nr:uncharacterized protein LOC9312746 [Arabidopsis lyrata subsp. lyrata]EFH52937.1 DNAJ heat shock N-terminal domain-containing protein [Arabidopsis lyrata subsp. lyrata]CAH8269513.1 unnamed protein product [Arabidopsis lyrata]|eukprot:XP_020879847.1 uncharacterized protein LOC9312746 [Arabidopsis lyrata subsp. lyrata]
MAVYPVLNGDKKHWWFTHKKIVDKYIQDARSLMSSEEQNDVASAIHLLDAALSISPRSETALELKARSLLFLRRFKDVVNMLQDYIPSLKLTVNEEDGSYSYEGSSFSSSSAQLSRKLLSNSSPRRDSSFKCFSVSDLKNKIMAGICKNRDKDKQWRYVVLGQACCHLGLMEDALILLQTGKRLATAEFRRLSVSLADDSVSLLLSESSSSSSSSYAYPPRKLSECETVTNLLAHTKNLLRRRAAGFAAFDAGLFSDSIRHFSKILDGRRRPAPQGFLADCYMHRAAAYKSAGKIAEAIADCNKTLALEPSCIHALETRAALLETVRCLPDSLHDLEHLKILYNTILRDRKLPGPPWKRHNVKYREIPGKLCELTTKSKKLKAKIANGEIGDVDYYGLVGVRRGCTRSELDRANLLLCLRHKPDKALAFIERCDFFDQNEISSVKDRAKMSSLLLYRLIQRGYSVLTATIAEEEQRKKMMALTQTSTKTVEEHEPVENPGTIKITGFVDIKPGNSNAFQGVFCRDLAAVGSLLSRTGFNQPIPMKYDAISC